MPNEQAILKRLRAICLAFPSATETITFGHPTFQVAKKTFCVLEEYTGELCIVFKAELPAQRALIQSPRFLPAPYIGKHGWVSLRCSTKLDWGEIKDLVRASYRCVSTAKLIADLDGGSAPPKKSKPVNRSRRRRA